MSIQDNTELKSGVIIDNVFYPRRNLSSGTLRIILSSICNFSCKYCFSEGEPSGYRSLTPEQIRNVVKVGRSFGIDKIKLSGGEPFLYPKLEEVLCILKEENIPYVDITTNASLLSKKEIDIINRYNVNAITVSIDSLNPILFNDLTDSNSFESVFKNLNFAIKSFNGKVRLNSIVFDYDLENYLEILNFCKQNSLGLRFVEPTLIEGKEITYNKEGYNRLISFLKSNSKMIISSDCSSVRYYNINDFWITSMNSLCDNFLCKDCLNYMYLRLSSEGMLKPCLYRTDTEIKIDFNDLDSINKGFIRAINLVGVGADKKEAIKKLENNLKCNKGRKLNVN